MPFLADNIENITEYTSYEGGIWLNFSAVYKVLPSDDILMKLEAIDGRVNIRGVQIHSFKTNEGRVWDCINRWRK